MKKNILFVWIIIFLVSISSAFGQEKKEKNIVLSELIQEVLKNNPEVKAAYGEWQAALERVIHVKSFPDPMFSYSHFGRSIETRLGPQRNKFSLSQKIPFFGKLSLKGKIAERRAFVLEEHYSQVRADVILKVKEAYFSLYWIEKVIQISQEEKEVLKRLARISQKKYETGLANQQDILKVQLEISKVEEKILNLSQGRRALMSRLNALLYRPPEAEIGDIGDLEIQPITENLEALYQMAKERRPELRKVRRLVERNEESLKLAKKNYYPDFTVMFDYIDIGGGSTDHPRDGRNAWMGSVSISIPLWRKKLHAAKAEAMLHLEASKDVYSNIQNETFSMINELYHEAKTAEEQVRLYKYSLLPQAEQSFKASEVGYLAGKVDFLNLLDSERMVLTIRTGYHKALADYSKSLSRLERIVGRDLVKHRESKTEPILGQ